MRAFLLACVVAIVLAVVSAYVLNSGYIHNASSQVFTTKSVRI